jgi:c-di-GMP-binding flagellar brake protein YcgR
MAKPSNERRRHTRHPLGCPARLVDETGRHLASGKTVNISDGGLLMPLDPEAAPQPGQQIDVKLSVPRSTPNTFLMQGFTAKAIVVRHDQSDDGAGRVAVRFEPPLELDLDV